ncbi:MAG TPA: cation:proton antiporter, partial [Rhodocyclaceae bacterium]|nr:cation:proton antiporter [Rhodocyclaceae bacterium]
QVVLVLTVLIWLGQKLMGRMFDSVAQYRSDELFILATIWIVVGLAWVTESAGLSLALGAFVGGMLVSETAYRHHVESDIRPFRDMLLGLFFVTIGMLLNIEFVLSHLHLLILAVFLLVTGKALVMLLIALAIRTPLAAALRTAAQLAQGGEFGLVLIEVAHRLGLVDNDVFQITLSAMLASMFVAPFLIERAARFSGDMGQGDWAHKTKVIHDISVSSFDMEHHVIVCGYGRTGERIGQFLAAEKIPFLALEVDMQRIKQVRHSGFKVNFGSAERAEVLQAAGIGRAQAVVVTYPDAHSSERVVRAVRRLRPNVPVVVRAPDDKDVARLKAAGATEVISEVMEGSLLMAAETLAQCGVPMERGMQYVREARAKRYVSLREFYRRSGR